MGWIAFGLTMLGLGVSATGRAWGFWIAALGSISWMLYGMVLRETPIFVTNVVLCFLNILNAYRWDSEDQKIRS